MIQISQKHRHIACLYHDGMLSQLYHVCSSGMVAEKDAPHLVKEVRQCIQVAKDNGDLKGERQLRDLLVEVLKFDTFEFAK